MFSYYQITFSLCRYYTNIILKRYLHYHLLILTIIEPFLIQLFLHRSSTCNKYCEILFPAWFSILPRDFYFAAAFSFCRGFFIWRSFFILPWFLFCREFFVLLWLFCFTVAFLFWRGFVIFSWLFLFCRGFFILPWLFCLAVVFALPWFFVLPWLFGFAVTLVGHRKIDIISNSKITFYDKHTISIVIVVTFIMEINYWLSIFHWHNDLESVQQQVTQFLLMFHLIQITIRHCHHRLLWKLLSLDMFCL